MEELIPRLEILPLKPTPPEPNDCCGSGCSPCVHDIYEKDLKLWQESCTLSKKSLNEIYTTTAITPYNYTNFELIEKERCSLDTYIFTFRLPEGSYLELNIGQSVVVKQKHGNKWIMRQYTPISDPTCKNIFQLIIKIYPKGKMSQIINFWEVGIYVPMRGPFGTFKYETNGFKKVLMFAAGTGIAPFYQIIKLVIRNDDDYTVIRLLYCSKSFDDILLRNDLALLQSYWNFTICHFLSEEVSLSKKKYSEEIQLHKLMKTDVMDEIKDTDKLLVLICGTKSFEKDMMNAALDAGVIESNIIRF